MLYGNPLLYSGGGISRIMQEEPVALGIVLHMALSVWW